MNNILKETIIFGYELTKFMLISVPIACIIYSSIQILITFKNISKWKKTLLR
jgi:hypothetical protein